MPTNDFIGFASAGSANVMSQADYAVATEQTDGVQPGPASSALANKVWRQGANMAAALAQAIVDQGFDAADDGDIATLSSHLKSAIVEKGQKLGSYHFYTTIGHLHMEYGRIWTTAESPTPFTFSVPFVESPFVVLGFASTSNSQPLMRVVSQSTTGFDYDYLSTGGVHTTGASANFIAIGMI